MPEIKLLAVRAGGVRISIFADSPHHSIKAAAKAGGHVIFRTSDLASTIARLKRSGVDVPDISEASGFMRYIALKDPSGNLVEIAEYLRDPLASS